MAHASTKFPDPARLAAFLTELAGFFEAADTCVDDALAAHFGEDTAVDWVIAVLELSAGQLGLQPKPVTSQLPQGSA